MRKSKRNAAVIAIIVIGFIIIAFLFGGEIYRKSIYEYKKSTHPLKFSEYVEKYSEEYGVDKFLLYSVIKTESGFDTKAVSSVGARGLMQIMEETFDWIKYRLGDEETVYDDMLEPEENIRYGAYLIDYLVDYFGNTDAAVAAYHSGIGAVSEWLTDSNCSQDGKTLYNIPSSTAAHYVNKINKALATYTELYGQERKY